MITITLKNEGTVVSADIDADHIDEVLDTLYVLVEAIGFHRSSIRQSILGKTAQILREENDGESDTE